MQRNIQIWYGLKIMRQHLIFTLHTTSHFLFLSSSISNIIIRTHVTTKSMYIREFKCFLFRSAELPPEKKKKKSNETYPIFLLLSIVESILCIFE